MPGASFDIPLLFQQLIEVTEWFREHESDAPLGYFGASTGASAALIAAAHFGSKVDAVVSRGGRPDLAGRHLRSVTAHTLFDRWRFRHAGDRHELGSFGQIAVLQKNGDRSGRNTPLRGARHTRKAAQVAANWLTDKFPPET